MKKQILLPLITSVLILTACGAEYSDDPSLSDTSPSSEQGSVIDPADTAISEAEALAIASSYWGIKNGDIAPENGFIYRIESRGTIQTPDGITAYDIYLRWLVEIFGPSHYSTVENIWVDTATGAVMPPAGDLHVHAFGDWTVVKEATCTEEGMRLRLCPCGDGETRAISPLPHAQVPIPAVEPTITEDGLLGGIYCETCDQVLTPPTVVPYIGHTNLACGFAEGATAYTITGRGECTAAEVYIPAYIDGREIRFIAEEAFFGDQTLTALRLPTTLCDIETAAFAFCTGLRELVIPDSVLSISPDAFYGCSGLTRVVLPDDMLIIHSAAFSHCTSLTDLQLPEKLQIIHLYAFEQCTSLTRLVIPEKTTEIQSCAFRGCSSLTEIYLPAGLRILENGVFDGCTALTDIYFGGTEAKWNSLGYEVPDGVTVHFKVRPE